MSKKNDRKKRKRREKKLAQKPTKPIFEYKIEDGVEDNRYSEGSLEPEYPVRTGHSL